MASNLSSTHKDGTFQGLNPFALLFLLICRQLPPPLPAPSFQPHSCCEAFFFFDIFRNDLNVAQFRAAIDDPSFSYLHFLQSSSHPQMKMRCVLSHKSRSCFLSASVRYPYKSRKPIQPTKRPTNPLEQGRIKSQLGKKKKKRVAVHSLALGFPFATISLIDVFLSLSFRKL